MTIPNLLTLSRMMLTPLLAWLLLYQCIWAAFCVFFLAGLTDALDGLLARVLGQKSKLGSFIDPLADKLLLITSFLLLWQIGFVPPWLMAVAVGRDIVILSGFVALLICRVPFEIKPMIWSKLTTLLELGTIFTVLGKSILDVPQLVLNVLFFTTAGFAALSGGLYFSSGISLYKKSRGVAPETRRQI
jgi:cardiolipin synthase (CMP-forming)